MNEIIDEVVINPLLEFSVKLCAAVQKEKCLYDRTAVRKNTSPDIEAAWERVSTECKETIEYCKYRWSSMYKSFYTNYRRRRNYYLHEHMTFLLEERNQPEQDEESINDDRNSIEKCNDDVSRQESEMETINLDGEQQQEDSDTDSQTASADELNENSNGKTKEKFKNGMREEMEEEMVKDSYEKRLMHKRACKRGLDPGLINELADDYVEDKRPRRSLQELRKSLSHLNEKQLPQCKVDNKAVKIKPVKVSLGSDFEESKIHSFKTFAANHKNQTNKTEMKKMVDQSTNMDINWHDASTQYEAVSDAADLMDEMFLNSVKLQLRQMNGRQKLNFKSKTYRSLMEAFDDANDFPLSHDIEKQSEKDATPSPLFDNTTTGELRLMRELACLVQAAKSTPEIVKAQDKVSPEFPNKSPVNSKTTPNTNNTETVNNTESNNDNLLSLGLEDDIDVDFNITTDNLDDDEDLRLPRSLDEIMVKTNNSHDIHKAASNNVMGLPRHVLQKVVKAAGPNGSTIVTHNGDKKRIYRIYPKSINPQENRMLANKNPNSVGTFFVAPSKTGVAQTTHAVHKSNSSSSPTITVRNFANRSANVANAYPSSSTPVTNPQQNHNNNAGANKKMTTPALYKSVHPANRILDASTGLFQTVNSSPSPSPPTSNQSNNNNTVKSNQNAATNGGAAKAQGYFNITSKIVPVQNSMLPPTSLATPAFQVKKPMQVRSHINIPRRFSICGSLASDMPSNTAMSTHSNANKDTNKQVTVPQMRISNAVSLNKSASNTNTTSTNNINKPLEDTAAKSPIKPAATSKPVESSTKPAAASTEQELTAKETEETPIIETAATIAADSLDPLYVKQTTIKLEPVDD